MKLHLGVIDLPYAQAPSKRRRKKISAGTQTTGDVAGWLENDYHVMEHFWALHSGEVVQALEGSLQGAIDNMIMGAPMSASAFGSAESAIEDRFKQMLSNRELDVLGFPGIPTAAAQAGVSHRRKRPSVKRGPRPSFIDTGLYQASFKAWVET